jgi:cation-transporting ATPase G
MGDACCGSDPVLTEESEEAGPVDTRWSQADGLRRAAVAGGLLAISFLLGIADADAAATALIWGSLLVGASTFVPDAVRSAARGRLGVGALMTIAAVGAVALGEATDAAALAFLFSISEGLESFAMARTRAGLRSLLRLVPDQVTVLDVGDTSVQRNVASAELLPGDVMLVRPGERAATDGIVRSGSSMLDLSVVTGESAPVLVEPGGDVPAGAINVDGALDVEVTRRTADSTLAAVVRLVEAAQQQKGATQRLADRIAAPLVPGVLVVASFIATVGSLLGDPSVWIERALVVLVAASPCALAIAVPVTVIAAIGSATRHGILIKGGAALEQLGRTRTVAIDKTGTLTANKPIVTQVQTIDHVDPADAVNWAAALEARADHPLGDAIVASATDVLLATEVTNDAGSGVSGLVDGHSIRVGRPGFITPGTLGDAVRQAQGSGATAVLVERDGRAVALISVRDEVRAEAAAVVRELQSEQGQHVVMLTGDHLVTAQAVGAAVGVDDVRAGLLPADKATIVASLRGPVAMVGDGVNDAPALARASVGIAMGARGSDVAIDTADVALMGDDLYGLAAAISHARRSRRIMLVNVGIAIALIGALAPLALFGVLGLTAVVAIHEATEVVVILNGVRAGRFTRTAGNPRAASADTALEVSV